MRIMGAEPSEVFSVTPAINRGIPRVVHFVNCVGLTPLCFSGEKLVEKRSPHL